MELFAGVGGFRLGIERAIPGAKCVYANEWDEYAAETYQKHFGEIDTQDIKAVRASDIPAHDLITGGFPCPDFSIAGKRKGFGDPRGRLFFEIVRIARHHRTPYLFLENVTGLLSHDQGDTFEKILRTLDGLRYDVQWQVLNSKDFGVPQRRERVFIVASLRGKPRPQVFPITGPTQENPAVIKSEQTLNKGQSGRTYDPDGLAPTLGTMDGGGNKQPKIIVKANTRGGYEVASPGDSLNYSVPSSKTRRGRVGKQVAQTLDTGVQQAVIDGEDIRRLTPVECERLQGFPDGWTEGQSDRQRYRQMGNAVTVNVIEAIASRLVLE